MDPITLAKTATSLLVPFLSKAGEKAMDRIAEQLPEKIGAVSALAVGFLLGLLVFLSVRKLHAA